MRLRALSVRDFRCIESAQFSLEDGLNVLYGPNDLGKSSLVEAIRSALLLQHSSKQGSAYKPWGTDRVPHVELTLTDDTGRHWRIRKDFSTGRRGGATLEWSNDGATWTLEDKNRGVDGKLRTLLAWGVPDAGVRGGRGAPSSFLATILVGPQLEPGAVFNTSLADDKAESGRERLSEALQALAEDPLFKDVLDRAQALVEKAFDKSDRRRTAKDSPFRTVHDRIKALTAKLEALQVQVLSSENVRDQLGQMQDALNAALSEREEALQHRDVAEAAWQAQLSRKAASERLAVAIAQADAIAAQRRAIEELRDQLHTMQADLPAAEAAHAHRKEALDAAEARRVRAQHELEQVEQGGDAGGKLRKQSLQTRRLELQRAADKARESLRRAEAAAQAQDALQALQELQHRTSHDVAAAIEAAASTQRQQRLAEAQTRQLDQAIALRRLQEAETRLAEAKTAADTADRLRDEAATKYAAAEALEATLSAADLPSTEAVATLLRLWQDLQLAQARLGGGLALRVVRAGDPPQTVRAAADDDPTPAPVTPGDVLEASGRLVITLDGGVELEVMGGESEARAAAEQLRAQWSASGAPTLARLRLSDPEALARLRAEADDTAREAVALRAAATSLEAQATSHRAVADHAPARAQSLQQRQQGLVGLDRRAVEAVAGAADEATLARRRAQAQAAMEEATRTATHRDKKAAELQLEAESIAKRVDAMTVTVREAVAAVGAEPGRAAEKRRDELAATEGKLEQVDEAIEALERQSTGALNQAKSALGQAEAAVQTAKSDFAASAARLEAIKASIAKGEGELVAKQGAFATQDEAAAGQRVERRQAELDAIVPPQTPTQPGDVEQARDRALAAEAKVGELERALATQQGQLKQVGGNVIVEERIETEQALAAARADEAGLELDYDAYKLLVEVLRQAERAEGNHLGQALSGPVRDRFAELTAGRYGALHMGADLEAQGLEAAGAVRAIGSLSAGLQEQLATLLRLAVAEQLDSALVLDDHLTQTDPTRIEWFRHALQQTAAKTQVVVMTCRDTDYVPPGGHGSIHTVDLSRVIRRIPSPTELPAAD